MTEFRPISALFLALSAVLSGCNTVAVGASGVTPSTQADKFDIVATGQVQPGRVSATVDCVFDAVSVHRLQVVGVPLQIRRAGGWRIDEWNAGAAFVSVEIRDSGEVTAKIWRAGASLIPTSKLTEALKGCMQAGA